MAEVLDLRKPKPDQGKNTPTRPPARSLEGLVKPKPKPTAPQVQLPPSRPDPVRAPAPESAPATQSVQGEVGVLRKWGTLLVLSLALAIIIIDTTLLNVSLRSIIADLHTDIKGLQWVITSYALVLAALTITGGRLGDLFGRKKMFVVGAIIFAIGSFLASVSHSLGVLVAGESIIEGLGAALMMPATASILVTTFHGRERAIAFGVWGSIAGAASAVGPILGGYLTTHYSWRWGFRINVVVAAVLVAGAVIIRESRDKVEKPQLDVGGVLLSAGSMLAIVFGIIQSSTYGWLRAKQPYAIFGHNLSNTISVSLFSIVLGVVLLVAFILWERRQEGRDRTPLVSLNLFKIKQFTTGAFTMALTSLGMMGLIFVLPVFLQAVLGLDALHTGYALLPMSLSLLVVGPLSGFMTRWVAPKRLIQAGLIVTIGAIMALSGSLTASATSGSLAPALVLYGIGLGLIMAQISNLTLSAVSVQQAGEASGVNNTLRQVGSSLGSAILGAVLLTAITANVTSGINRSSVIPAPAKAKLVATVGANASNAAFGGANGETNHTSAATKSAINSITKRALSDASHTTVLYGIIFTVLALIVSTRLPSLHNVETEQAAQSGTAH